MQFKIVPIDSIGQGSIPPTEITTNVWLDQITGELIVLDGDHAVRITTDDDRHRLQEVAT